MENIFLNPIAQRVQNGTLRSDVNLCLSCRQALHNQSGRSGKETLVCTAIYGAPMRMTEPVAHCTAYLDRAKPTLNDMHEVAWLVMTDKGGRQIGFLSPEELRERAQGAAPTTHGF
jgi:hypothetical protein